MNRFIECVGVGKIFPGKNEPVEALRGIDFVGEEGEFAKSCFCQTTLPFFWLKATRA